MLLSVGDLVVAAPASIEAAPNGPVASGEGVQPPYPPAGLPPAPLLGPLASGSPLDWFGGGGRTALMEAAQDGNVEV